MELLRSITEDRDEERGSRAAERVTSGDAESVSSSPMVDAALDGLALDAERRRTIESGDASVVVPAVMVVVVVVVDERFLRARFSSAGWTAEGDEAHSSSLLVQLTQVLPIYLFAV